MPTYDKQQITKAISSMQAICDKGKAEVTKLVEAIIGEPLEDYTLRAGDVWENRSCRAVLVELNSQWALTGFMSNYFDAFQLGSAFYKSHLDMQTHLKERNYKRIGKASTTIQPL